MQATRQQHSSSASKNCTATAATAINSNNNNKSENSVSVQSKSVAQRVMEVASNTSNSHVPLTTQVTLKTTQNQTNNSMESDQEVEDITNRAAKLEVGVISTANVGSSQTQQATGDQNNNCSSTITTKTQPPDPSQSSPSSLLSDNNNSSTQQTVVAAAPTIAGPSQAPNALSHQFSSMSANMANFVGSESVFRQIVSQNNFKQTDQIDEKNKAKERELANNNHDSKTSVEQKESRISLDTKVPHPSKSDFKPQQDEEEVSYYNDQATNLSPPIDKESDKLKSKTTRPKSLALKDHKLSVIAPTSCSQQQQSRHINGNGNGNGNNNTSQSHQISSREYLNEMEEEDDYDTRYDNAMMVEGMAEFEDMKTSNHHRSSGVMSTATSPKAKSAPATPCNVTPTAFHQHTSHLNSMLNPSPANTLPPDIRKNISATCRVLPSSRSTGHHNQAVSSQYLDELIKRGDALLETKDYGGAIRFFSQCIELTTNNQNFSYLKKNFRVYSQRAEAHFNLGNYHEAIDDSMAARELNPKWTQAYYRQGRSQFLIGQHADSLAVFSFGLAQDPTSKRLFEALVDASLKSVFRTEFEPKYNKLKALDLDKKQFVVVSVLGQELLAKGHGEHAAIILESALKMGVDNKKLKGSVLSTIGFAYCIIKDYEKAVSYMQKELDVESELEDVNGQCRVLSNLGYTYYKMRKFDKSLESHRKQLTLAMRTHLFQQASVALNAIGHVHSARNDFTSALTSHTRCLEILKQLGDNDYNQYKELLSIGHIHSMLGDYKAAEERYNEGIQMLESSSNSKISREEYHTGLVMVNFNLAYLALKKQSFSQARQYYLLVIKLAQGVTNPQKRALYEMRASNGMGQAHRLFKKFDEARSWFERQLQLAKLLNDRVGQSQALCNLGMTYQHFKDYNNAWKLFDDNLHLVERDPLLKAYAHSYMGSIYFMMSKYNEAQAQYESSLNSFKDLDYCSAEKKTIDLNMAAVQERMGHSEIDLSNVTQLKKVMMA